ncbi:Transcription factor spt20 [Malassezia nana]|uniref:Transcription factor spt20 n=1 Tax=Malassezia nana TaxID=180528 RepID=A0AAF0J2A8_9BASI|nr:Transcription factor spt20 [Malassezia nana]
MATSASVYNYERTTRQILKRHRKDPASFSLHIHAQFLRFEKQEFLHYLCNQIIPVDLMDVFQQAGVPFFEGCLIVEVHDHRKRMTSTEASLSQYKSDVRHTRPSDESMYYLREGGRYGFHYTRYGGHSHTSNEDTALGPDGVEVYRIVLRPSDESLWNDLRMMDARAGGLWSDEDALEIEAQIVNLTAPPLCLTPDTHVTRIANLMLSSTVPPPFYPRTMSFEAYPLDPVTGHRLNSIEREQAKSEDVRREQIMQIMKDGWASDVSRDGSHGNSFVPSFSRLDFLRQWRKSRAQESEASGTTLAANAEASKNDAKKPSSAKKRAKDSDDTKLAQAAAAAVTMPDTKTKTKRRRKDSPSAATEEEKKLKRAAGAAASMSPSGSASTLSARASPAMAGKMDGMVVSGPKAAVMPGSQASPTMGVGMGLNPLVPGMGQGTTSSPFVPPGNQPSGAGATNTWFMPL